MVDDAKGLAADPSRWVKGSSMPAQMLELRGLVEACLHWKNLLIGNALGIQLLSDHGSLRYVESMRAKGLASDTVERWAGFLSNLNARISWSAGAGSSMCVADWLSRYSHDPRSWDDVPYVSKYDRTRDGMKSPDELLKDMSLDAADFGAFCDEAIDGKLVGDTAHLLAGLPITKVLPVTTSPSDKFFDGVPIGNFLRLSKECVEATGVEDIGCPVVEAYPLDMMGSHLRGTTGAGHDRATNRLELEEAEFDRPVLRFKHISCYHAR